jgi:hypothetical protein
MAQAQPAVVEIAISLIVLSIVIGTILLLVGQNKPLIILFYRQARSPPALNPTL